MLSSRDVTAPKQATPLRPRALLLRQTPSVLAALCLSLSRGRCLLEDLNNLRDAAVSFRWPLSPSIQAWQLGRGNLCLASLNSFPPLMRLIEWPFIHRGLLMCHGSNVNHPGYFGKLTELHSLLALSESRACVSPLVPPCETRRRESPLTLFYSPQITSLSSLLNVNGQGGGDHPDSLHHGVSVHR